ncbi:MAG: hypothetical protein AB7H93_23455 [Vicinamibacterales bacterium]
MTDTPDPATPPHPEEPAPAGVSKGEAVRDDPDDILAAPFAEIERRVRQQARHDALDGDHTLQRFVDAFDLLVTVTQALDGAINSIAPLARDTLAAIRGDDAGISEEWNPHAPFERIDMHEQFAYPGVTTAMLDAAAGDVEAMIKADEATAGGWVGEKLAAMERDGSEPAS